jgi:tRNA (mo5U34)-methyltransferase
MRTPETPVGWSWYHTIDLPDGNTTPGFFDTREVADRLDWPAALKGGRCLDVGTFDGFWAFAMEQRGAAEVIAADVGDEDLDLAYDEVETASAVIESWGAERGPGFAEAARQLKSQAIRIDKSVYNLDPDLDGTFDVVFCGALLLHLRDPVRALEAIRSVCRGELLLVEALDPMLELTSPRRASARFRGNWDQWWRVNSAGLAALVYVAGFDVTWMSKRFLVPYGPGYSGRASWINNLAARTPTGRGSLFRALRAKPRERRPTRSAA